MPLRIALIINPRHDPSCVDVFREQASLLRASGHEVHPRLTFEAGDAERFAAAAARGGADLVVMAGGDGTLNEVVNGVCEAERWPRLAVVPMGTGNDFGRGLGVPEDVTAALDVAVRGRARPVDVARVNERFFINVSTGGFGAAVTENTPSETKRLLGAWAYVVTGVREFADLRATPAQLVLDGEVAHEGPLLIYAVGNGRQTGGGMRLTPEAELDDGLLDVVLVPDMPRMDLVALLPELHAGRHVGDPRVTYAHARDIVVSARDSLSVNADGEPLSSRRLHYRLDGRRLEVMVP